jgi:hypothetical protein
MGARAGGSPCARVAWMRVDGMAICYVTPHFCAGKSSTSILFLAIHQPNQNQTIYFFTQTEL